MERKSCHHQNLSLWSVRLTSCQPGQLILCGTKKRQDRAFTSPTICLSPALSVSGSLRYSQLEFDIEAEAGENCSSGCKQQYFIFIATGGTSYRAMKFVVNHSERDELRGNPDKRHLSCGHVIGLHEGEDYLGTPWHRFQPLENRKRDGLFVNERWLFSGNRKGA